MDRTTYVEKAQNIVKEYQPVDKNPAKKLEAETKVLIAKTMKDKVSAKQSGQSSRPVLVQQSCTACLKIIRITSQAQIHCLGGQR